MIKAAIIHPQLISCLAQCGHKTQILLADANYSFVTHSPPTATIIYLNLAPGMISSPVILEHLLRMITVERAVMMAWPETFDNSIVNEFRQRLPADCPLEYLEREEFYINAKADRTLLVIGSGEMRRFANLLLTVAPCA
ncbi:RbsD/FucU family protein [Cedecea davisae]|uniref:RbsD/FucU family protein n=1 Tax=Cedecea davisae TaxID=158484 RepID=A0ABS6DMH8_9ENTR|nr:RbsD/FucU domain-containing protein [Cedecea davisae]MBU4684362.1 RbsD/FucU family protein [Cedecea davisae]MBU4688792.1 RbsD/FucU family protein [Cedecea davisae]